MTTKRPTTAHDEQQEPVTAPQPTEPDIYLDEDVVWRFRK